MVQEEKIIEDTQEIVAKLSEILDSEENGSNKTYDVMELLLELREVDDELYIKTLKKFPNEFLADVVSEMPAHIQEEVSDLISFRRLAKVATEMDTDDAADFIQTISEHNENRAEEILEKINVEDREEIRNLISYEDDVAGAYMQIELFTAKINENIDESIKNLRNLKNKDEVKGVYHVFITDDFGKFICSIGLEEVIIFDRSETYEKFLESSQYVWNKVTANHKDYIRDVVERVSDYNLSVIPVVDEAGYLLGRITSDDIYDIMEDSATEDIFHMAGVNADAESGEDFYDVAKSRGFWLAINLVTAIAASIVIGLFDQTIGKFVSLAVLMPIVASMGGNAGTQTLTVTVRQLAIGEIDWEDGLGTIKKEILISLLNGLIFAVLIGVIAHLWFGIESLGLVIAASTIINLFIAGLFGSTIPLILTRFDIDPAIGSTVLLTTATDIFGFLTFLGLAKLILV